MKDNIKLRALEKEDIEKTIVWHNQEEIKELYAGHPFPVNMEQEKKWYDKILLSNFPTTVFGIEKIEDKKLIGITIIKNINLIHRESEFAIYIGDEEERGKGYSRIATLLTLKFGFYSIGLNRIFLKVLEENTTAINLYEKVGFIKEGMLRKSVFKNNDFKNEIIMSILRDDYIQIWDND
jgi:RimJ/RimL family protein N-acetyltransferase